MVHQPTKPSSKALGKRPMRNGAAAPSPLSVLTSSANSPAADEETDDGSLAPSAGSVRTRLKHKRVLPSRVRRGGVGSLVGTNDIDQNILDMLRRKGENDPLIPAQTVFILTTDGSQVPSGSTSEIGLNNLANERYFERPEVIKAYKKQQNIQVPEFSQVDEETVGGRLRARSSEVEPHELSDTAYEKRHRKYEMVEKRQRLREKEKLQHEHYKLKERIDQLRIMDYNAFLALSDDNFTNIENDPGLDYVDGAEHGIGGVASLHEAERRRRLMLGVAVSLEERYRTLLPTERRPAEPRLVTHVSVGSNILDEDMDAASIEPEPDGAMRVATGRSKPPKLKLKVQPTAQPTPPPTAATEPSRKRRGASFPSEPSPAPSEVEPGEGSITVTASHSISSRQTRSRKEERAESPRYTPPTVNGPEQGPAGSVPDSLTYPAHTPDASMGEAGQLFSMDRFENNGMPLIVNHERAALTTTTKEAHSFVTLSSRRRRRAMVQANRVFNVIQYITPQEQELLYKKTKSLHAPDHSMLPSRNQFTNQVAEAQERMTEIDYPTPPTTEHQQTEHEIQAEMPVASTIFQSHETLPPPPPPSESAPEASLEPPETIGEASEDLSLPPDERSVPFAQLRQLEKPDQDDEFDITEQPGIGQTPTADEPVTPASESALLVSSLPSTKRRSDSWAPNTDDSVSRNRRRHSRTPVAHPEPGPSELPPSTPLKIISMQSYEIPAPDGSRKRIKTLGGLMAVSRHNEEPGRKTGRSVKAFGVDVPPFEEEIFELPRWMVREVASRRKSDIGSDAESDGDPPSFVADVAHGEVRHWTVPDSISAVGRSRTSRQ